MNAPYYTYNMLKPAPTGFWPRAHAWACAHPNLVASSVSGAFGMLAATAFLYRLCA